MKLFSVFSLVLSLTVLSVLTLGFHQSEAAPTIIFSQPAVFSPSYKPKITAKAYGIFDVITGELIYASNEGNAYPIASVTKLFTAAHLLESEKESLVHTMTNKEVATYGRAGKLKTGQKFTLHELLFPLLLESSNDAATAIANEIGLPHASDISLADPSGLSALNQASVRELAREVSNVYKNHLHIFDITKLKQYVYSNDGWVNNSPVYDLPNYLGGKHGYTEAANHTLVALFANKDLTGHEKLGYILLGSDDLRTDLLSLQKFVKDSVVYQ